MLHVTDAVKSLVHCAQWLHDMARARRSVTSVTASVLNRPSFVFDFVETEASEAVVRVVNLDEVTGNLG